MVGAMAVGLPTLALGGGALLAGGLAMGVGATLSSALVSAETAENIKKRRGSKMSHEEKEFITKLFEN